MTDWENKWASVQSKYATCVSACITDYRSDSKCKDSIEAVVADIWNMKDWLQNDPSSGVTAADITALLNSPGSFNLRGCGDIETKQKHLRVDDPRREDTALVLVANHNHPSGLPVVYGVERRYKNNPGDLDSWEDAVELARRAIEEWRAFLTAPGLLPATP